jgi:hypothetical protein
MSSAHLGRRHFLTLSLAFLLAPSARAGAGQVRRLRYECDVRVLYGALRYRLAGGIEERMDEGRGQYLVTIEGEGTGFANRGQSSGVFRDGRWMPVAGESWVKIAGREGRAHITYDHDRRVAHYRSRSETFFLGRVREVDDVVALPPQARVDDMVSAILNRATGHWPPAPSGALETHMVRRRRALREGEEEVQGQHSAEIVPVALKLIPGPVAGKYTAAFDLARFSSWAVPGHPATIVFGTDARPETVTSRLMYGTTFSMRFAPA